MQQIPRTFDYSILSTQREGPLPRLRQHHEKPETLSRKIGSGLHRNWTRALAGAALLLLLEAFGQSSASAATIFVGGQCTLARAITAANADTTAGGFCRRGHGADKIVLPRERTFSLRTVTSVINGPTGLPWITSKINIKGNGSVIQRLRTAPRFRIFTVVKGGSL